MRHTCPECHREFTTPKTASKYCSHSCASTAWRQRQNLTYAARFWARVRQGKNCWLWQGGVNMGGYGKVRYFKRNELAHRVAYLLTYGADSIPADRHVMHRCDERLCCRPEHLSLGTPRENIEDCVRKGRNARGSRNGASRLTEAEVRAILAAYPDRTYDALAAEYGVSKFAIGRIIRGTGWQNVAGARPVPLRGNSRTTLAQRNAIRQRHRDGTSQWALATEFGLSQTGISRIIRQPG
jgi:uncharacterized protein YerC